MINAGRNFLKRLNGYGRKIIGDNMKYRRIVQYIRAAQGWRQIIWTDICRISILIVQILIFDLPTAEFMRQEIFQLGWDYPVACYPPPLLYSTHRPTQSTELSLSRLSSYLHYRSVFTRTFIIILSAYRPTLSPPPPPSLPQLDAPRKSWIWHDAPALKIWFPTSERNRCLTSDNRTRCVASLARPLIISMSSGFAPHWAPWESLPLKLSLAGVVIAIEVAKAVACPSLVVEEYAVMLWKCTLVVCHGGIPECTYPGMPWWYIWVPGGCAVLVPISRQPLIWPVAVITVPYHAR